MLRYWFTAKKGRWALPYRRKSRDRRCAVDPAVCRSPDRCRAHLQPAQDSPSLNTRHQHLTHTHDTAAHALLTTHCCPKHQHLPSVANNKLTQRATPFCCSISGVCQLTKKQQNQKKQTTWELFTNNQGRKGA